MTNAVWRLMSISISMFFLAVAFTLHEVDSFLIDFSAMPSEELMLFRYVFYGLFLAFLLMSVLIGDEL